MRCPRCGSVNLTVTDVRQRRTGWIRMRKCNECGLKFKTAEVVEDDPMSVRIRETRQERNIRQIKEQARKLGIKLQEDQGGRGVWN